MDTSNDVTTAYDSDPLAEQMRSLAAENAAMRARLDELTDALEGRQAAPSRRRALRLAGAAAAGGVAALAGSRPAAAAAGGNFILGQGNDASSASTSITTNGSIGIRAISNSANGYGLQGFSTGNGTGVYGEMTSPTSSAYGVWGLVGGTLGYGVVASGGASQLLLDGASSEQGPRNAVAHLPGEVAYDGELATFFMCVGSGNPGTWRIAASPASAGALIPITPTRVYDSRQALPSANTPLATGQNRLISIKDGRALSGGAVTTEAVPAGATSVAYNITAIATVGSGFLTVNPGGNTTVSAASVNWSATGQNIGNASIVKINAAREVTVICGGTASQAHFAIDIVGYYA